MDGQGDQDFPVKREGAIDRGSFPQKWGVSTAFP